jgi:hypothetical protein
MSHAVRFVQPIRSIAGLGVRACDISPPSLSNADKVFVLKHRSNILRAPLTPLTAMEPPMAMVFSDRESACEFQYQFDPSSTLHEVRLGELETHAHAYNLPLRINFPTGEYVVRSPKLDLAGQKAILEGLYRTPKV